MLFTMEQLRLITFCLEYVGHVFSQSDKWKGFWDRTASATEARTFAWRYLADYLYDRIYQKVGGKKGEAPSRCPWAGSDEKDFVLLQFV